MKALSIKQPWASLIAHGIKDIENRTWRTHFRGKIYIHASAKPATKGYYKMFLPDVFWNKLTEVEKNKFTDSFEVKSAIIGEVEIVDCVVNHHSIWAEKTKGNYVGDGVFVLSEKPIYNWVLANAKLYEKPILNVKGKLSFWEWDIIKEATKIVEELANQYEPKKDSDFFEYVSQDGYIKTFNEDQNTYCEDCSSERKEEILIDPEVIFPNDFKELRISTETSKENEDFLNCDLCYGIIECAIIWTYQELEHWIKLDAENWERCKNNKYHYYQIFKILEESYGAVEEYPEECLTIAHKVFKHWYNLTS